MGFRSQEFPVHIHVNMAHGPVRGQVEHRLSMPGQLRRGGSRGEFREIVLHHAAAGVDDDDPHRVPVETIQMLALALLGPVSLCPSVVAA